MQAEVGGRDVHGSIRGLWPPGFLESHSQMAPLTQHTHKSHINALARFPTAHSLRSLGLWSGFLGLECSAQRNPRVGSFPSFLMYMRPIDGWALAGWAQHPGPQMVRPVDSQWGPFLLQKSKHSDSVTRSCTLRPTLRHSLWRTPSHFPFLKEAGSYYQSGPRPTLYGSGDQNET